MTLFALALAPSIAHAADEGATPSPEDELPIPSFTLDRIPPRYSYELAMQVSFGEVAYFRETVPPWVGFGLRGGWGKHFGMQRLGLNATFGAEGELGVNTYLSLEPALAWDFVSPGKRGGVQVGAGIGPALGYTASAVTVDETHSFEVAPSAALRLGWSQGWTRVGRRLFVFVEPKVRWASDGFAPLVALAVGSGGGR